MNMLDLVLSLAFLGVADDAPPMPATPTEHVVVAAGPEQPQGIKELWPWSNRSHRHRASPTPRLSENLQHECNTPAPGPLPLVLLGVGVLGVGTAARSRRRKRRAAARALSRPLSDR